MVDFLYSLNKCQIEVYKTDICKVDCKVANSDLCISNRIWKMTVEKYGLLYDDYSKANGLKMLQNGIL